MSKLGKWSSLVGGSFLVLTGTISCSKQLQENTKKVKSQIKQQDTSGDLTTEPDKKEPLEEVVPKVVKTPEEQELDVFEAKWLYRPAKPLAAYPELDERLSKKLYDMQADFAEFKGYKSGDYSYFLKDNKQELYVANEPDTTVSGWMHGDIIFDIAENIIVWAIYYEIYDFAHDREVENNIEGKKRGITESHNWDYLDPYNV